MAQLNLQNVSLTLGNSPLFDDIEIQIHQGEKICLLGRNGAGKSTMMKLINGEIEPDSGSVICEKGLKTALLPQDVPGTISGTVYSVISGAASHHDSQLHHLDNFEEQKVRRQIEKAISLMSLDPDCCSKIFPLE